MEKESNSVTQSLAIVPESTLCLDRIKNDTSVRDVPVMRRMWKQWREINVSHRRSFEAEQWALWCEPWRIKLKFCMKRMVDMQLSLYPGVYMWSYLACMCRRHFNFHGSLVQPLRWFWASFRWIQCLCCRHFKAFSIRQVLIWPRGLNGYLQLERIRCISGMNLQFSFIQEESNCALRDPSFCKAEWLSADYHKVSPKRLLLPWAKKLNVAAPFIAVMGMKCWIELSPTHPALEGTSCFVWKTRNKLIKMKFWQVGEQVQKQTSDIILEN